MFLNNFTKRMAKENNLPILDNGNSFWHSMNILMTKPHVINKRLWGYTVLCTQTLKYLPKNFDFILKHIKLKNATDTKNTVMGPINYAQINIENGNEVEIILIELLPKNFSDDHAFQLIYIQKSKMEVTFTDVTPQELKQNLCPAFSYSFHLINNEIILRTPPDISDISKKWLNNTVLPQVKKWSKEVFHEANKVCNESLKLVPSDKYYKKYNQLKLKYGKEMVKIWPECTDPTKFVYEDVAIATYLLLLWEKQTAPQSFVDIGCGNGLLVYILTMEGHKGFGVDVRKRKIWDVFPDNIELKEMTITPSNINTIINMDWIIGNHSDELTPWIPVIAAKSSYKCNFFLLPCCAYNFDGTKYQRQNSSKSQYTEYLEYIQNLCESFGFETRIDRLKIPSTKRICFISRKRIYDENDYQKYCTIIDEFVIAQTRLSLNDEFNKEQNKFKTRDTVERVRNCTQIDKGITESIVNCITHYLLDGCDLDRDWSKGKKVQINDLIQIIPSDKLKVLKSECGGLQTLLRNNYQIFEVQKGYVQLRFPRTIDEVRKKLNNKENVKMQEKKCWFYNNHPQGCPLDSSVCSFLHDKL